MSTEGQDAAALREALDAAGHGGKRFRPRLLRWVHDVLDGPGGPAVDEVAEAVELLHTAFLVHDDLIDGDDVRRGVPSTPGAFRAAARAAGASADAADTYAAAGAVLTGDLALTTALRKVATAPLPPPLVRRVLDLFDEALFVSAAGELADVRLSLGLEEPTLEESLTMAEQKTAVYSFALPMQCGAVLADAPDDLVEGLGAIGRQLGVAYQLLDDLKGLPQDLREGKRTPLMIHARTTAAWPVVQAHLGDRHQTPEDAELVRAALDAAGSLGFVADLAGTHVTRAREMAASLGLPPDLFAWVDELTSRRVGDQGAA